MQTFVQIHIWKNIGILYKGPVHFSAKKTLKAIIFLFIDLNRAKSIKRW